MSDLIRWMLIIEYKGTDYCGWQRQAEVPSIQQAVEEAIEKFSGHCVRLHGSGRTDAGVHARGQVAHFDAPPFNQKMNPFEVVKAINAHLRPQPIAVLKAMIVDKDFHARFSAKQKTYHYRILSRSAFPTLERDLVWHIKYPLDLAAMQAAAQSLVGYHDFTTFRAIRCQGKSPMKTLDQLNIIQNPYDKCGGQEIIIEARGQSFLHHQVRNMAGTLALVGKGQWTKDDVVQALEAKDRTLGGPTAPAQGLYLMHVDYK